MSKLSLEVLNLTNVKSGENLLRPSAMSAIPVGEGNVLHNFLVFFLIVLFAAIHTLGRNKFLEIKFVLKRHKGGDGFARVADFALSSDTISD